MIAIGSRLMLVRANRSPLRLPLVRDLFGVTDEKLFADLRRVLKRTHPAFA